MMSAGPVPRLFPVAGAFGCAAAVALGAHAAHAVGADQDRLQTASLYLFLHGLALLVLSAGSASVLLRAALSAMLLGMLLFCGSLAAAALLDGSTMLAPWGGGLLILAWLLLAVDRLRGAPR